MLKQMKYIVLGSLFFCIIFFPISTTTASYQLPEQFMGFGDLIWGRKLYDIDGEYDTKFAFQKNDHISIYYITIPNPRDLLGFSEPLVALGFFIDGHLFALLIPFQDYQPHKDALITILGQPQGSNDVIGWEGSRTLIILQKEPDKNEGNLWIIMRGTNDFIFGNK